MHRRPEAELLPLDIELEKTLRNMKKVRKAEALAMAKQREMNQNVLVVAPRAGNRVGRAWLGRANNGLGQNRAGPKLARFFWAQF